MITGKLHCDYGVREIEGGGRKKGREGIVWMHSHPTSRSHLSHPGPSGEPKGDPRGLSEPKLA
jgi:hypothetical protein